MRTLMVAALQQADGRIVIVLRRSSRDVALVPAAELAGLIETAHLLRSPKNAQRLLAALRRAKRRVGIVRAYSGQIGIRVAPH